MVDGRAAAVIGRVEDDGRPGIGETALTERALISSALNIAEPAAKLAAGLSQ